MGFRTYARRVRDEQLPLARRHTSLRCAVGQYCPLGFNATWAYLAATARPSPDLRKDPAALLRALETLEASRAVRLNEVDAFAVRRHAEKAVEPTHPTPHRHTADDGTPLAQRNGTLSLGTHRCRSEPPHGVPAFSLPGRESVPRQPGPAALLTCTPASTAVPPRTSRTSAMWTRRRETPWPRRSSESRASSVRATRP